MSPTLPRNPVDAGEKNSPTRRRADWDLAPADRFDARQALRILEGSGLSLTEAARRALAGQDGGGSVNATLEEAADGYLRRLLELKRRGATFRWYESRFRLFAGWWPGRRLDAITRREIRAKIDTCDGGPSSRAGYLRAGMALYRWALSKEPPLARANPFAGLRQERESGARTVPVLSAAACAAMLHGAGVYRHALALMLFAGIRPEEIAGADKPALLWEHIDRADRVIRIPGEIAKTGRPRTLEDHAKGKLPPALWQWLKDGPKSGRVCPYSFNQARRRARACLARLDPPATWSHDVLRHTAASYLMKLWGDAGRVSDILGHEGKTSVLHQRYRGLMSAAEAKAIAAIRPPARGRG